MKMTVVREISAQRYREGVRLTFLLCNFDQNTLVFPGLNQVILKNRVIFETLLLSPRLSHPNIFMRRFVYVLLIAPEQIRTSVRWQLSSLRLSPIEQLSNRAERYSRTGLIIVLYLCLFFCLFINICDCPRRSPYFFMAF